MRPVLIIIASILGLYLLKIYVLDVEKKPKELPLTSTNQTISSTPVGMPVDIFVAKEVDKSSIVFATGTVVPNEEVSIKSEVSGRIIQLNISEGRYVKKGALIAKLDDSDLKAQLKRLQYQEELAAQTEARQKKLLQINAISKEEYDMAVNNVNILSADKELLKVQLEKTSVIAPFSGTMGFKNISEGAYITPGEIIANLVQTNPAKLDFSLPEKYSSKMVIGQKVSFSIDGDDTFLEARVIALDPKIDENLRTLRVRAQASNNSGKLMPGMFIRVEVPLGKEKSLMVPSEAITPVLKGKKVFVVQDGKAQEVLVKTGLRTDTDVQIVEGLNLGDSVIVSAMMSIKQGMTVTPRNIIP